MPTVRAKFDEMLVRKNEDDIGFCALFENKSNTYIGEAGILSMNKGAERCVTRTYSSLNFNFIREE